MDTRTLDTEVLVVVQRFAGEIEQSVLAIEFVTESNHAVIQRAAERDRFES